MKTIKVVGVAHLRLESCGRERCVVAFFDSCADAIWTASIGHVDGADRDVPPHRARQPLPDGKQHGTHRPPEKALPCKRVE